MSKLTRTTRPETLDLFEGAFNFPLFRRLGREIDFLFDRFGVERRVFEPAETVWTPDVEMFRRGNEVVVKADIPGMKKEDLTIEIADDQLILKGTRKQEKEEKHEGYYRAERTYGSFFRALPLPDGVKADQVKASIADGVLEITMPTTKAEETLKTRKIEIGEPTAPKSKQAA